MYDFEDIGGFHYKTYPDFSEKNFLQYSELDPATCSLEPDFRSSHHFGQPLDLEH